MKKIIFFLLLSLNFFLGAYAQHSLVIDSVYEDSQDLEARANFKLDVEGNPLALVKIVLPLPNVKVDKESNAGVFDVVTKTGEIWSWITATEDYGATEITIQHEDYYPLTVKFQDYGIEPKGKSVYRILVSIPSVVFEDATRLYNGMKFAAADSIYRMVLEDASSSNSERIISRKRLQEIPELIQINKAARHCATQYINLKKSPNGVPKEQLICTLDSAIYWYGRLKSFTSIPKAQAIYDKFVEIKGKIQGTKVFSGVVSLMQRKSGQLVKLKNQELKGVIMKIYQHNQLTKAIPFDTDNNGRFDIEVPDLGRCEIIVEFLDGNIIYTSGKTSIDNDKNLNVKLFKQ